ncbi:hypothetical protein [Kribbella shirazensis]|uniref:Multisubunit Na+/H+ antiporter MnhB subunit n=1 Tax=Kribbella shirazensis TaxID=1105143 RepID=A0A7X5V827_9ACTN|nr:hypothetical protein [Kribbella shirazensis]NIK56099.1 multisubunit Na+/H+ antiporter MnhB subunit [Kribbella shirazensis]
MVAIVTVLFAFALGFFLRNRISAYVAYVAIYGYAFTFQTLYLLRDWVGGDHSAFAADPETIPFDYLAVTAGIYLIGLVLVALGHRLGTKRRTRARAVDLDVAK